MVAPTRSDDGCIRAPLVAAMADAVRFLDAAMLRVSKRCRCSLLDMEADGTDVKSTMLFVKTPSHFGKGLQPEKEAGEGCKGRALLT